GDVRGVARICREEMAKPFERLEASETKRITLENVAQDRWPVAQTLDENRSDVVACGRFASRLRAGARQCREEPLVALDRMLRGMEAQASELRCPYTALGSQARMQVLDRHRFVVDTLPQTACGGDRHADR